MGGRGARAGGEQKDRGAQGAERQRTETTHVCAHNNNNNNNDNNNNNNRNIATALSVVEEET